MSGVWRDLTENVNFMAGSLTTQVRAIADVSTAVTQGDLTRSIDVEAKGEVSDLKDNVNQMISTLRDTTQRNAEQDWLNSNLARFGGMMQGQRDLKAVSRLIMSELTPLVLAHHGAFFVAEGEDDDAKLRLVSSYGYKQRKKVANEFKVGEALVGQTALEKQSILITDPPDDYIRIASAFGEAVPRNIIVMPVLFEDEVMAVIELAAFHAFTPAQLTFMEQLAETIGVVLNTIQANMRTEELLDQSQSLAQELQSQSEELQTQQEELQQRNEELEETAATLRASEELLQQQQEELQQTNEELEEKARQLEEQNARIEIKNQEIELARSALEEKAEQLALSSKYKSEFLANMSHELRTPLNSLLILAKLLGDNPDGNLTSKQVEFSSTIHSAGSDLLDLINDILDLSKVEAGKMDLATSEIPLTELRERIERAFQPVAEQKRLAFEVTVSGANVPPTIVTDPQRLEQILRNLLSNAFKFTDDGSVSLRIEAGPTGDRYMNEQLNHADGVVAFVVSDTGIGIPHDKLRLIFEAFQQADGTTSRRYGGTGLGLSISREIAVLLGGEIRVESSPGKGASFTLYLPATYAPPAERAPAPPALPRSEQRRPHHRARRGVRQLAPAAERGVRRPRTAHRQRPRRPRRRRRRRVRPHRPGGRPRAWVQDARRAARRHRPRARARVQARRDRARPQAAGDRRRDAARPAEAPPGDAAHPGAHRLRRRRPTAGAAGRRGRVPREARRARGARRHVRLTCDVHRPRCPQPARGRGRREPAQRDRRARRRR